nr:MAG TPA: hypothetical protein [Caudoviricetes sp.]
MSATLHVRIRSKLNLPQTLEKCCLIVYNNYKLHWRVSYAVS